MKVDELESLNSGTTIPLAQPELANWNPPLSGEIDMVIDSEGRWIHEGDEIKRNRLVQLFSSILKLEVGEYFLVTPVEKWRLFVEAKPFCIIDFEYSKQGMLFTLNTGHVITVDEAHPLKYQDDAFVLGVRDNLEARFNRACYYRFVDWLMARGGVFSSKGFRFDLSF